jgi:succinate-acetate transporter protein
VIFTFCLWSGGVIPFVVAIWEIVRNNLFAAITFFVYGSFFLSYCTFGLLLAAGGLRPLSVAVLPIKGLQYALLIYAIISIIFIALSTRMNVALTCVFTSICLSFFCTAAGLTEGENATKAGGYFSILVGICTWYVATAELLVDLTGKAILPVGWYPWAGEAKMHAAMTSKRRLDPHVAAPAAPTGTKGAAIPSNAAGNGASMV